jgi:hypothetical protein
VGETTKHAEGAKREESPRIAPIPRIRERGGARRAAGPDEIFNYETRGRREKGRVTTDSTDSTDKRKRRGGARRAADPAERFNYETRGRREKGRVTTDYTDFTDKRKRRGGAKRANGSGFAE